MDQQTEARLAALENKIAHLAGLASRTVQKRTLHVVFGDLAIANTVRVLPLDVPLPAGAQIIGIGVRLGTPFTGGAINAGAVKVGPAGNDAELLASSDVFAAAVNGQASTHVEGIAPHADYTVATQLLATFTSGGANWNAATAGACDIDVLFAVVP